MTSASSNDLARFMDVACATCRHVIDGARPVCYLSNDDGRLTALCAGHDHDFEQDTTPRSTLDCVIVCFDHLFSMDPTLGVIAELQEGWTAERGGREERWAFSPIEPDA